MKTLTKSIPAISIMFIAFTAISQEKDAPLAPSVNESFNEMYPDAVVKSTSLKKDGKYEIKFIDNELEHKAYFTQDGTWLYKERIIAIGEITVPALEAFRGSRWAGWKIERTEEVNSPDHPVLYVIKVRREDNVMFLHFLPDGSLENASSKVIF